MSIATQSVVGRVNDSRQRLLSRSVATALLLASMGGAGMSPAFAGENLEQARGTTVGNAIVGKLSGYLSSVMQAVDQPKSAIRPGAQLPVSNEVTHSVVAQKTPLRGTTMGNTLVGKVSGYFSQIVPASPTPHQVTPGTSKTPSWYEVSDVVEGLRDGIGYTVDNAVDTVLFRPTHDAVAARDVTIAMPGEGPLRQSMMHSMRYESGLRETNGSIADTVSATLRGSYNTRTSLERVNVEKARMHAAIGNFLPRANLTIEGSVSQQDSATLGPFDQDLVDATIDVTIPIFTSGVNTNTYRQAKHTGIAAKYTYLADEQAAALEAVAAHVNLRLNRKIEAALRQNVTALRKIQNIAERLFEAGDASRTDIAIAKANVESARSEVDIARRTREETLADYESLTGKPAPTHLQLSKPESLVPESLDAAIDTALARNPTMLAAEHTAVAGKHNAKAVRGRFGPQVNGFASYDHTFHDSIDDDPSDNWSVGVRLTVPLVDFTTVPTIDAARHEAAEAEYRALEQGRLLRRQLTRQWSVYRSAVRRLTIDQQQVNAVADSLEGSRREYEAGFRSITDVLNNQVRLTRARIALENTRHERILAAYQIAFTTANENVQHIALAD